MHSSLTGTLDCLDNFLQSKLLGVTNKVLSMNTARHICVRTNINLSVLSLQDEDASADEEQQEQPLGIVVSEEDSEFEEKVCAK